MKPVFIKKVRYNQTKLFSLEFIMKFIYTQTIPLCLLIIFYLSLSAVAFAEKSTAILGG